jgi:hypothetical protein
MSFVMKSDPAAAVPARCRRHPRAAAARRDDARDGAESCRAEAAFVGIFFPHGMAPGPVGAAGRRCAPRQTPVHPRVTRGCEEPDDGDHRALVEVGGAAGGTTGSDHWVAAAYLTGIKPRKTAAADATVGSPTIDQQIAQKIGSDTLLPSLQLAVEDPNSSSSNCGEGYSCSYTNSISWVGLPTPSTEPLMRTAPLPMELNPQVVFERLFGSGGTPELRAARLVQRRSILDALVGELTRLRKDLGPADRLVVNQYVDEIREIERRLELAAKASSAVPNFDLPPACRSSSTITSSSITTCWRSPSRPTSRGSRRCWAHAI